MTCAFSAIMIAELSSALIIQSHSQQIQINKEDIPELGTKTLKNWFHRQIDFGSFQPIIDTYFPRIFKKTAIILPAPIQHLTVLPNLKNLKTAADLIVRFGQIGLAYIILTKETGLALYESVPIKFRHRFIDLFKKTPENFAGIASSGALKGIIKTLDRFGIVTIFLPFVLLAICLAMLPDYLLWLILIAIFAHLAISVIRLFKKKSP